MDPANAADEASLRLLPDRRHPHWRPLEAELSRTPYLGRRLRRAFREFLKIPLAMLAAFGALAALTIFLDLSSLAVLRRAREPLRRLIPADAAVELLVQVAPAVLSVASLTFSVLLVAVQQNAAVYTPIVFDQFLRRRANQAHFGFFLGLSFYAFVLLAAVRPSNDMSFGALFLLLLTTVALVMLVTLIYGTIDQMRPTSVLPRVRDIALHTRYQRRPLLAHVRDRPRLPPEPATEVTNDGTGFIVDLRLAHLVDALRSSAGEVEVVLENPIGTYLSPGDVVGHVRGADAAARERAASAVRRAIVLDQHRDPETDPAYAMEQIAGVAWNAYSGAAQSPLVGAIAMRMLVDLFSRWVLEPPLDPVPEHEVLPVVYPDLVVVVVGGDLLRIPLVSTQGHATPSAEVMLAVADVIQDVPTRYADMIEDRLWRILPVLEAQVAFPAHLERSARHLVQAMRACGRDGFAQALEALVDARAPTGRC
jgi:uncharacterized membrane protein